ERDDKTAYPCFHPLAHVGSLPVSARCPSSVVESEFQGRASQRRCNVGAASTSTSSSFSYGHFRSRIDTFYKLSFGLRSGGRRRHGFRVSRATEDGGGEKGGGKTTSTATEEPENDPPVSPTALHHVPDSADDGNQTTPVDVQMDAFKLMELIGLEKVDPEDVKVVKEKLCGYTTYWVTGQEPYGDLGEGVLLLGNLRGNREDVFAKLTKGVRELFGSKYDLFMVEEPNAEEQDPRGGPRVSFLLLRKEVSDPGPNTLWQYGVAVVLCLLTVGSCVELGIATQFSRLPPNVAQYFSNPESIEPSDMQLLVPFIDSALPLAYGILEFRFSMYEVGHSLAAQPRKVKLGISFLIPNITLGSFGAITQLHFSFLKRNSTRRFKSVLPDKMAKFDVSIAGPLAGGTLSLVMLGVGLSLSMKPEYTGELLQVPTLLFQGSVLLGTVTRAVLGYDAMHAATVGLHPLVIAGWYGLTTTAFNFMPVGCLDGGRAMRAAFGKTTLTISGVLTYASLVLGLLGGPLSVPWGFYVLILQRQPEKSYLNDVTEVGTVRKVGLSIVLLLVLATLLPFWDGLREELGIGLSAPPF
ncbi:hypothetical protein KC19_8G157100, partial [Ceratodon purpureus]